MNLRTIDEDTIQLENTLEVAPDLVVPRWVRLDRSNAAWLAEQAARFAQGGQVDGSREAGPDQLALRVGGTDQEPCLIVQNTHADGSSRGSLYLSEEEARALPQRLQAHTRAED